MQCKKEGDRVKASGNLRLLNFSLIRCVNIATIDVRTNRQVVIRSQAGLTLWALTPVDKHSNENHRHPGCNSLEPRPLTQHFSFLFCDGGDEQRMCCLTVSLPSLGEEWVVKLIIPCH